MIKGHKCDKNGEHMLVKERCREPLVAEPQSIPLAPTEHLQLQETGVRLERAVPVTGKVVFLSNQHVSRQAGCI